MATCSASDLLAESACFCSLGNRDVQLVELALLCRILQANDPMAQCDVSSLMESAKCFDCLTPHQMGMLQIQLLCEILQSGGGGGASCLLCGEGDPVDEPQCSCAIYYNRSVGSFWIWDANIVQWYALIGA